MTQDNKKRDWLDYAQLIGSLIASVAIPITLLMLGNQFAASQNDNQHRLKYTEIAILILQQQPSNDNIGLRSWATEVLNSQSPVPMTIKAIDELGKKEIVIAAWYRCKDGTSAREYRLCPEFKEISTLRN